jgi:hypothetical protein
MRMGRLYDTCEQEAREEEKVNETMKFYEFNDAEYYALIRANNEQEAVDFYYEMVTSKEENEELHPDVITKAEAKIRILKAIEKEKPEEQKDTIRVFNSSSKEPCLFLIAADLC